RRVGVVDQLLERDLVVDRAVPVGRRRVGACECLRHVATGVGFAGACGHHALCASEWSAPAGSASTAAAQRAETSCAVGASTPRSVASSAAMPASLASSASAKPVAYVPVTTCSPSTISLTKLRPVDVLTISTIVLGSSPNSRPISSASVPAA